MLAPEDEERSRDEGDAPGCDDLDAVSGATDWVEVLKEFDTGDRADDLPVAPPPGVA